MEDKKKRELRKREKEKARIHINKLQEQEKESKNQMGTLIWRRKWQMGKGKCETGREIKRIEGKEEGKRWKEGGGEGESNSTKKNNRNMKVRHEGKING